jgi:hypothetical protein
MPLRALHKLKKLEVSLNIQGATTENNEMQIFASVSVAVTFYRVLSVRNSDSRLDVDALKLRTPDVDERGNGCRRGRALAASTSETQPSPPGIAR